MGEKLHKGPAIGGPLDGKILESDGETLNVPVNPHPAISAWSGQPTIEFDSAIYRWTDGAWHFAVH